MLQVRPPPRRIPLGLVLTFSLLAVGIGVGVRLHSLGRERNLEVERSEDLLGVADLKVSQLVRWRRERLGDAVQLSGDADLSYRLERYLSDPSDKANEEVIRGRISLLREQYGYSDLIFCDTGGSARLSIEPAPRGSRLCGEPVSEAIRSKAVFASDFLRDTDGNVRLVFAAPILRRRSTPIGAVLLVVDPANYLYPFIQAWPTPSPTAETLLVERHGDTVLFLNRLRHRANSALSFALPLSRADLPAAQAVMGREGANSGKDYRGVEVLGAARRVPETPWYLVAKMDRTEALAPLRGADWTAILMFGLLVLSAAFVVNLLWRQQQLRFYRGQYEAEARHKELAQRFEYLTRYANDIILLFDENGNIVEANELAVSSYGYPREELLRLNIRDLREASTLEQLPAQWDAVHESGSLTFETLHRRRDGSVFPVEVSTGTVEFEGRKWVQSIVRDSTERRKAEAELKRVNRALRMLTACNEALIRSTDEAPLFKELCRIAVEVGGYKLGWVGIAEHDEQKKVSLMAKAGVEDDFLAAAGITWADEPRGRTPMGTAIRTGRTALARGTEGVEHEPFRRFAESHGIVAGVGLPLRVEGQVVGGFGVYTGETESFDSQEIAILTELAEDLSFGIQAIRRRDAQRVAEEALQQREAQLRQWQKLESIGRLAGSVAHDFNNYLTVIDGYCDLILAGLSPEDPLRRPVSEIRKSGERATQLTRQLLAFGRRQALDLKPISLADVLKDSQSMLRRLVGDGIEVVMKTAPDLWPIMADPGQIQQVLMNLAANARDAMPSGGKLTARAWNHVQRWESPAEEPTLKPGEYVLLTVEDSGVGMDEETRSHVFEPFFTTKPPGRGTGFGLSTVYGIVTQSGGWISVQSHPGRGTTFRIRFPRSNAQSLQFGHTA
jgi:two-component system, cell cycle sensor histidine kinase and response regulator CckA